MIELKPCPFCGDSNHISKGQYCDWQTCFNCGAYGPDETESGISWNHRAQEARAPTIWHEIDPKDKSTWPEKGRDILLDWDGDVLATHLGEYGNQEYYWGGGEDGDIWLSLSLATKFCYIEDILKLG